MKIECYDSERPVQGAFLVGSPRSGTTLLQSLLFAHPAVLSFPETFFFAKVVPSPRERWRSRVGLASAGAIEVLHDLDALGVDPVPTGFRPVTVGQYARLFLRRMEASARRAQASLWLEKTPDHLRYLQTIERHLPEAKTVHIIRSGDAVVASLYDVKRKHPDVWRIPADPSELVEVWKSNLHRSHACIGRQNHAFVSYERLVEDTEAVLSGLCAFLGLPGDSTTVERLLADYDSASHRVSQRLSGAGDAVGLVEEPWKATVAAPITNRNGSKFEALFDSDEQHKILLAVAREEATVESFPYV
jgi:sulfotransferase family protein